MILASPAFADGARLPLEFAKPEAGGRNVSPPLEWSDVPSGTRSLVLAVVDHAPVARLWLHWAVVDIPPHTRGVAAEASGSTMPGKELANTSGGVGWGGPKPPPGTGEHPYVMTLYALDVERLGELPEPTARSLEEAVSGHMLDKASITGYFGAS